MKHRFFSLAAVAMGLLLASAAWAGPGSVEVQTTGDITIRMGAQVRLVPTSEIDRDFGLSGNLENSEMKKAAGIMPGAIGNTRAHLNEAGGEVKDSYIRGENRLFFNFAHGSDWDVYMMLESDTTLDRSSADRTDFALGKQSQQFGIERLNASFNMPWIHSRLNAGWDVKGADVKFGGMVYGDDDPGIGISGGMNGFKWTAWYLKKDETEAGYPTNANNATGGVSDGKSEDRTFWTAKLGYQFAGGTYLEGFYFFDKNDLSSRSVDRHFFGLNYRGEYGIIKPIAELVYITGETDDLDRDYDIESFAFFGDILFDLSETVGIKKFDFHFGGYWLQGDDDPNDKDLEGFTPAVGITRFTPRFGGEQTISMDGNPVFGQILYSMFPAYYGTVAGGGINGGAKLDNPGFRMIGTGIKAVYGNWTYTTNLMAMWFDEEEAVENYFINKGVNGNVKIDSFMGLEWNNEIRYKLFKAVTIKGGAAFLFPGSGAKDITKALDAFGRGVDFAQGRESDDVSMRFAAELLWFF